ncbi:Flp pilus assembly protein CpaB [Paraburkholderia pallida]|uniref:Flp pilus assembly protein CpaB n=1 Tax=Paraburkholderia pallida TaxID=2547399 RepID=A0A4P7CXD6_9BURK|nr:Flp pilus assembly protein CpaB [Paraburkholderia pallida]QBR00108.1 Flp pilus assembly protein CpaB [Paraburkholderia pallida]
MQNFIKLAALVVIAAIGAFIIRALFIAASSPHAASHAPMVRVRAAADDLPDGLLLRDADLVWKTMPRDQVPAGALVEAPADDSSAKDLKGDLLRHAVRAGTPLGVADVILPGAPGFLAAALKPGMRAISVAVDDVSGNAGLIQPGDYVDILLTQQMRNETGAHVDPARAVESETVAERVRVLAVGTAFRRPKDDDSAAGNAPSTNARTVTIEVTPTSAQTITVAAHLGTLSLALRSFATRDRHAPDVEDVAMTRTPPVWAGDVSRALRGESAPATPHALKAAAPAPHVVIYRGSTVEQADVDLPGGTSTGAPGLPPLPAGMLPAAPPRADAAPATAAGS